MRRFRCYGSITHRENGRSVCKYIRAATQQERLSRLGGNIRKLRNSSPETWRYRIGEYRFFYQIDEQKKIIFMIAADHRKQAAFLLSPRG